jgi:N6-adenosine-specific RNA methylase IME4
VSRLPKDVRTITLHKGPERYTIVFTAATATEACRTLGRWACDPELSFTWYDAAQLSRRIREGVGA